MFKGHDCIFVNGDSYSVPLGPNTKVYSDWLSEKLDIPVVNVAAVGSSNQRILRSSIEYIEQLRSKYQNPLVLIGWTFVHRLEVWYPGKRVELTSRILDTAITPDSKLISLDWLLQSKDATPEHKALVDDTQLPKRLTDFYTDLYLFGRLLESMNVDYRFFSAARNTEFPMAYYPHIRNTEQGKWVINNPKIFKLHEFCVQHWAETNDPDCHPVTGHLSPAGHLKFTDFLLDNLLD